MRSRAACYDELRQYVKNVPLIDTHDHTDIVRPKYGNPLEVVVNGYFRTDMTCAVSEENVRVMDDMSRPLEERWAALERAWKRTQHTGYAQMMRRVLKRFYGEDAPTLAAGKRIAQKMLNLDDLAAFEAILEDAKIVVRLVNHRVDVAAMLAGTLKLSPRARLVIGLPAYPAVRSYAEVDALVAPLGRHVTSLEEYLRACREIFAGYKRFGAVAFKDQSAYSRALDYGNPTRAAAEEVFNWFMYDPRRSAGHPDGVRALSDFLFHQFMRMAAELGLPVQLHTGQLGGLRNNVARTNAIGLVPLLELHRDVRFDLFHANWPYGGELLSLAKTYPNVAINFCWANVLDPIYCQNLFKQAVSSIPHGKVHGFGSDEHGCADRAWAHADITRDNVAIALADLVEMEYLGLDDAKEIACAWLFDNPNEFYRLRCSRAAP